MVRLHENDVDSFAKFMTDRLDESYEYDAMERELGNDFRIEKPSGDLSYRYNSFLEYTKSSEYENNLLAQNLLNDKVAISSSVLTSTLRDKYGFTKEECDKTLRSLANTKGINIHKNSFTGEISIKRV